MRAFAVMTFALACLVCAYGQSAAPVTIAAAQDDHGRTGWSATNTGTATVTAFAFTYEKRFSPGSKALKATIVRIYDAATEPLTAKPVPAGQTVRASFAPAGGGSPAAPQLRAVIFAGGGSRFGRSESLNAGRTCGKA